MDAARLISEWPGSVTLYLKTFTVLYRPYYLLATLPNTVHSCSWHGMDAARLTSEWPGRVTPYLKTFIPLGKHSQLQSLF
jgi:hypothetical protein